MTTEFKLKPFGIPAMTRLHTAFARQCLMTLSLALGLMMVGAVVPAAASECPALLNHKFNRLQDDSSQNLCQYSGKVVLVVNTASYCGFTSQYEGLEKLYANYKDKGLVILGFPSNDFSQEPGNNKEIADFCYNTYGVKFPMFAKTSVKGKEANALFAALIKAGAKAPSWNFNKYLIDREGKLVANYGSTTRPDEKTFISALEKALAAQ
jgi:glutathione peroxidase